MFYIPWKVTVNIGQNEGTDFIRAFPPFSLTVNVKNFALPGLKW
jgi:hypothetical protein